MGDLRLALRSVLRSGGTSGLAVLALGLALGANTSLFTLVDAVLLRALPFAEPDRVMVVREGTFAGGNVLVGLAGGDIAELPGAVSAFSSVAAWRTHGFNTAGGGTPERIPGAVASPTFFRVFPARILLGRAFDPSLPVGTREAVISERLWRRKYDSDPGVLGRVLSLNGEPVPIVGVVAGNFAVPADAELWITPAGPSAPAPGGPVGSAGEQLPRRSTAAREGGVRGHRPGAARRLVAPAGRALPRGGRRLLGIWMALGATAARVLREVVQQAMLPVGAGLLLGLGAALAASPLLRRFLYGVRPRDPRTLIAAALGLLLVALVTNLLAARRTSRANPAQALQSE